MQAFICKVMFKNYLSVMVFAPWLGACMAQGKSVFSACGNFLLYVLAKIITKSSHHVQNKAMFFASELINIVVKADLLLSTQYSKHKMRSK